jgi:hypothetical protein
MSFFLTRSTAAQGGGGGGDLVDGQAFTITGSGLGTRADNNDGDYTFAGVRHIHKRFTRFENAFPANGSSRATFESDSNGKGFAPCGAAFAFADTPSTEGVSIETGGPSTSGKFLRKVGNSFADEGGIIVDVTLPTPAEAYVCYKARGGTDGSKIFRYWIASDDGNFFLGTGGIQRDDPQGSWPFDSTAFTSGSSTGWQDSTTDWNRHELILHVANESKLRVSGTAVTFECYTGGNPSNESTLPMITSTDNGEQVHLTWPNSVNDGLVRDYADVYVDFTAARVEVTDGSKTEIQVLTSWADTEINGVFNKGELSSGAGTRYTYNASDAVIKTESVTIA